jgi:hypothetical protein
MISIVSFRCLEPGVHRKLTCTETMPFHNFPTFLVLHNQASLLHRFAAI